jgi:hypothetical protein
VRERADVEEELVDRGAARAPLHRRRGDGERQRRLGPEERRTGESADGAHRDRAAVELERERLAACDERHDGEKPQKVAGAAGEEADRPRCNAPEAHDDNE